LRRGKRVRIIGGVLQGKLAIFDGMRPHERVTVLLAMLGTQRHVELARSGIRLV
jgi:transcription antitermination factor NusG